jgi:hypothetical protein
MFVTGCLKRREKMGKSGLKAVMGLLVVFGGIVPVEASAAEPSDYDCGSSFKPEHLESFLNNRNSNGSNMPITKEAADELLYKLKSQLYCNRKYGTGSGKIFNGGSDWILNKDDVKTLKEFLYANLMQNFELIDRLSHADSHAQDGKWSIGEKNVIETEIDLGAYKDLSKTGKLDEIAIALKQEKDDWEKIINEVSGRMGENSKENAIKLALEQKLTEDFGWKSKPIDLGFKIRGKFNYLVALGGDDKFDKGEQAVFSYNRDFRTDRSMWNARGAVYGDIFSDSSASDSQVIASVEFDRVVDSQMKAKERDSLTLGLSLKRKPKEGDSFPYVWIMSAKLPTDFSFSSKAVSAETEWAPIVSSLGVNFDRFLGSDRGFWSRVSFAGKASALHVFDRGNRKELDKNSISVGSNLGYSLQPSGFGALDRFSLALRVDSKFAVSGDSRDDFSFEGQINYAVLPLDQFRLTLLYRDGKDEYFGDSARVLTLGLGVKF